MQFPHRWSFHDFHHAGEREEPSCLASGLAVIAEVLKLLQAV